VTHILTTEDGKPLGTINMDAILARAVHLGFELAVFHDDPPQLDRLFAEALDELGSREYGYVVAAALRHVVENVFSPIIAIADEAGVGDSVHLGLVKAAQEAREVLTGDGSCVDIR